MKTIFSEKHIQQNSKSELAGGLLIQPYERPERMEYILHEINSRNLGEVLKPQEKDLKIVKKVHDSNYVEFLEKAWIEWKNEGYQGEAIPTVWPSRSMNSKQIPNHIEGKLGYYCLANETSISQGSIDGAYEAVKVVLTATDMLKDEKSLFALCRPPGHHASKDQYGGYCFFNNIAIAAERLIEKGANKIFILDIDFHHGNGTQAIFYNRSDVFFASIHGDPKEAFPHFLGYADEQGTGRGEGYNINYPMEYGTPYIEWTKALDNVIQIIKSFQPEALLISLGVDTYEKDPISFFKLKSDDFFDIGKKIASCDLPTLFVMEGGYAIKEIGINTVNVLKGFEDFLD